MNKTRTTFLLIALTALSAVSCIKDEAPNTEADILTCSISSDYMLREPVIGNDKVTIYVKGWTEVDALAPSFTLTDGATIEPASGTERDFTTAQTYKVTSQDGNWSKTYTVEFVKEGMATVYGFENTRMYTYTNEWTGTTTEYYQIFYDTRSDGSEMEWGSGNAGYMITNSTAKPEAYPTSQSADGFKGKCAKLTTCSTGKLGAMFGAPIAAGNLFIGTFEINFADMPKSTHFGVPFSYEPTGISGYYKYKAGDVFTDKSNNTVDKTDDFDIYGILYEVTKDVPYLDGTNSLTSGNIVSIARLDDRKQTDEWTRFEIPFVLKEGKSIDPVKLANGQYNISIVMSSSKDGANFNGAVGSTLMVDEMEIYYNKDNE